MAEMDIRPEAVRVALHRLRNDGWISSEMCGRTGLHALTATAAPRNNTGQRAHLRQPCTAQRKLAPRPYPRCRHFRRYGIARGFLTLLPRVYLGDVSARAPSDALILEGTPAPDWLRAEIGTLDVGRLSTQRFSPYCRRSNRPCKEGC